MMMKKDQKKSYEKPKLMRYPLRPDEAVLGFCKTSQGNGPSQSTCTSPAACTFPGS